MYSYGIKSINDTTLYKERENCKDLSDEDFKILVAFHKEIEDNIADPETSNYRPSEMLIVWNTLNKIKE